MERGLLTWWVIVLAFASIANPLIAIVMLVQRHHGAAVLLGVFSVWSWLVIRATLSDLIKRRRRRQHSAIRDRHSEV